MKRLISCACALALAGCVSWTAREDEPPDEASTREQKVVVAPVPEPPPAPSAVELLVNDFARLRRLPATELGREQETARQVFQQNRSDESRIRLAMALGLPGSAASDDARALELLESVVKNTTSPLQAVAVLLASYIQEQRRLITQVQGLQQNVQGLQQHAQGLQQNLQALQQKLDALRTLERSLTERGVGNATRRR